MSRSPLVAATVAAHRRSQRATAQRYFAYAARLAHVAGRPVDTPPPLDVDTQDDYIGVITSLHEDAMVGWDWRQIAAGAPPGPGHEREAAARQVLAAYAPTFFENLFGKAATRRAELEATVLRARAEDEAAWRVVVDQWTWLQSLARGVLGGDLGAYQTAIKHLGPFEELEWLGQGVGVRFPERSLSEVHLRAQFDAVPFIEYNRLASGRTSTKNMPRTRRAELVQAHICSAAIRVARELFALLPLARVLVHVSVVILDPATGHSEPHTLLSVEFDRGKLLDSNFDRIDPASAVESSRHAMSFKKSIGLLPVTELEPLAQLTSLDPNDDGGRRR